MSVVNYGCVFALSAGCGAGVSYAVIKLYRLLNQHNDKEYKLALVARKDVKVPPNKIAVLCAHAAVMANENLMMLHPELYKECQSFKQPKVVLKADQLSFTSAEKNARRLGLQVTGITNVEGVNLVLAVGPVPTGPSLQTKEPSATEGKEVKLVVIVRKDLKMTKGKGISQCCHAAVRATNRAKNYPELYQKYMQNGRPTAVLKVEDLYEMKSIAANACKLGLLVSPINDAGRTQVAPGELTVVGLGPGPSELLDKVTEGLPEY